MPGGGEFDSGSRENVKFAGPKCLVRVLFSATKSSGALGTSMAALGLVIAWLISIGMV